VYLARWNDPFQDNTSLPFIFHLFSFPWWNRHKYLPTGCNSFRNAVQLDDVKQTRERCHCSDSTYKKVVLLTRSQTWIQTLSGKLWSFACLLGIPFIWRPKQYLYNMVTLCGRITKLTCGSHVDMSHSLVVMKSLSSMTLYYNLPCGTYEFQSLHSMNRISVIPLEVHKHYNKYNLNTCSVKVT